MERRQESLQLEYYSELQESKFCPARTLKNYTSSAFSWIVAAVLSTHSFALKTAAVQFVYNFLASLLDRTLIPAVPNNTPAAKEEQEYAEAVAAEEAKEAEEAAEADETDFAEETAE